MSWAASLWNGSSEGLCLQERGCLCTPGWPKACRCFIVKLMSSHTQSARKTSAAMLTRSLSKPTYQGARDSGVGQILKRRRTNVQATRAMITSATAGKVCTDNSPNDKDV